MKIFPSRSNEPVSLDEVPEGQPFVYSLNSDDLWVRVAQRNVPDLQDDCCYIVDTENWGLFKERLDMKVYLVHDVRVEK